MKTLFATLFAALFAAGPALAQLDLETRDWSAAAEPGVGAYPAGFEARSFIAPDGAVLPYRLLTPPATPEPPPLVIMLHGSGMAMGTDNQIHQGPFISQWGHPEVMTAFPAYVAAPQVATRSVNYQPGSDGLPAAVPGPSFEALMAFAEEMAATLPIDRRRIYLIGFSMGGSATLHALLSRPDLFAAGVSFAGVGPDRALAPKAAATPVMMVHGDLDPETSVEADRAWAQALAAAGGHPRMIIYRGMDHRVPTEMIAPGGTWRTWLFSQIKPLP